MTATNAQIRIVMKERKRGRTQQQAAAKANLKSRQTVAKYEKRGQLPSELKRHRNYRTREDAFAQDWATIEQMLTTSPEFDAKTLFEWLCEKQPGRYQEGQLRTFQRRVSHWRVENKSQIATLEQVRRPGEQLQTDGTWLTELGVTIQGVPYAGLLMHSVLPYSNWEWGRLAPSESLVALRVVLQSTLQKLGAVPAIHQTDNSSAATKRLGAQDGGKSPSERGFTDGYLELVAHFGMEPAATHVGNPNENGDVESSNGGLKRALNQHLLLRGSREFESLVGFEAFIHRVMEKRNSGRSERLAEELALMKPLPARELVPHTEVKMKVGKSSLIRVLKNSYTVPTSLIGRTITVRIGVWLIDIVYAGKVVETLPRLLGQQKHHINYRHIIDSLVRKPGGFRDYRYRDALFPKAVFRTAWEQLQNWHTPRRADLIYLQIVQLAARNFECAVADALDELTGQKWPWSLEDVRQRVEPPPPQRPDQADLQVDLIGYDQLHALFSPSRIDWPTVEGGIDVPA